MASSKTSSNSTTKQNTTSQSSSQTQNSSLTQGSSQSWGGSSSDSYSHTVGGSHTTTSTQGGASSDSTSQGGANSQTSGKSWASGTVDSDIAAAKKQYESGYQQSGQVKDTYDRLQNTLNNKPGPFSSSFTDKLNNLFDKIMNRDKFKYNFNADPMYQMYRQQYEQQGKQAMQDTMGQAAALTGGYASSYAQTAGQQQFQNYLQKANDIIPELRNQAYQEWQAEGQDLQTKYQLAQDAYKNDYDRYRDEVGDWQQDRNFDQSSYQDERNFDYSKWQADRSYFQDEYWKQKNAEQSNASSTDQTNWSKSHTDEKNWSNSVSDTSSWSDTTSHTDSTNWSNSLSSQATAGTSATTQNSQSQSTSNTSSSSSTSSSGSGSGSGSGSDDGTVWYKTSGSNGKGLYKDGVLATDLTDYMRSTTAAQRSMMQGAVENALSKGGNASAKNLLYQWQTTGYPQISSKNGKASTSYKKLNDKDIEYLAAISGVDLER